LAVLPESVLAAECRLSGVHRTPCDSQHNSLSSLWQRAERIPNRFGSGRAVDVGRRVPRSGSPLTANAASTVEYVGTRVREREAAEQDSFGAPVHMPA
jgi:hypothetical protein